MSVLIRDVRAATMVGGGFGLMDRADVYCERGRIAAVEGSGMMTIPPRAAVIEGAGRVLFPGFVDCHTHACWAGERVDEWERRLRGESYLDILKSGGGIMATVRAVRGASEESLAAGLLARLRRMLRAGTTTVEVKSGYGLRTADELKMLRAIGRAGEEFAGTVVMTALLGHAVDPEQKGFVDRTIEETLPAVAEAFPGIAVDAYCEEGAWSKRDCVRLFERAAALGCPARMHADQFHALGLVEWAVERARDGAVRIVSVDHLEATGDDALRALAESGAHATALPCSGFHTDGRYLRARPFLDAGGSLAVATNVNPGSAPCLSMPMAMALAVRGCGMTAAEAALGGTACGAAVLGLTDRGVIARGKRADLVLTRHTDPRSLPCEFGDDPVELVVCGGEVVRDDRGVAAGAGVGIIRGPSAAKPHDSTGH